MKKQFDILLLTTLAGGLFFNYLFWMEDQALNLLIYTLFIIALLCTDRQIMKTKKVCLAGAAHLIAAVLVVVNTSDLSIITWYITLGVFTGFVHFQAVRSIFTTLLAAILQFVTTPVNIARKIIDTHFSTLSVKPVLKPLKYIIIPFFVLVLFSVLYSIANPVFDKYQTLLTGNIELLLHTIFNFLFADLSFQRFMHLVLGILFTGAILIGFRDKTLELTEMTYGEQLQRKKRNSNTTNLGYDIIAVFAGNLMSRKMALKTENIIGIVSFAMLNLLLLLLNLIDITTLWQGADVVTSDKNFSAELHNGTNALIISIVMAMLVIVYFFNGNLNFYSKNKTLRLLAYIWIVQNSFLVLSVLLRDYHYIAAQGLTYKRIGVLIFLLLCVIGLVTVYIKVAAKKTVYYLLKKNTFIWYCLLLAFGFVNWDAVIANYNISHRNTMELDLHHLQGLSDKTLPLLWENRSVLKAYDLNHNEIAVEPANKTSIPGFAFENNLRTRIAEFKKHNNKTSWLSWNYRDWQTLQYLNKNKL